MKSFAKEEKIMDDLIRRQDAFDALRRKGDEILPGGILRSTVYEMIESLPSAKPELYQWQVEMVKAFMDALNPDWILCSKELPPDDRTVLVTLKWSEDDYEVTLGEYWHDSPSSKGWGTYEGHVIAWMPLPEPYKDGDANE